MIEKIPEDFQSKLSRHFPDFINLDYPLPKNKFKSKKMVKIGSKIENIFKK